MSAFLLSKGGMVLARVDMTIILPINTLATLNTQLQAILADRSAPIHLARLSFRTPTALESSSVLKNSDIKVRVLAVDNAGNCPRGSAGQASWLHFLGDSYRHCQPPTP